jgi:predicted PurR-regulated permease PerM
MPYARHRRFKIKQLASPVKPTGRIYGDRLNLAVRICWLVVLVGVIVYFAYHLLAHVATFTTVVIGAIFFAYLIFPVVKWLNTRVPLGIAIAIVYLSLALLVALSLHYVVPPLTTDIQALVRNTPALVHDAQVALANPELPLLQKIPAPVRDYVATLPGIIQANLGTYASHAVTTLVPLLISFVALGALFVLIPVVAAYMLFEAEDVKGGFLRFLPEHWRPKAQTVMGDFDRVVGGFLRGQIVVAFIIGVLVSLLLLGLHVQYAVLIGAAAGILDIIPYVGAFAGWLPAFTIALLTNGFENALFVTFGIVVINQLEGHLIAPYVVSKSVELSPLAVILALILGGELAGLPGLFIAVPVAGAIRVLIINFGPAPVAAADAKVQLTKPRKAPLLVRLIALIRGRTRTH